MNIPGSWLMTEIRTVTRCRILLLLPTLLSQSLLSPSLLWNPKTIRTSIRTLRPCPHRLSRSKTVIRWQQQRKAPNLQQRSAPETHSSPSQLPNCQRLSIKRTQTRSSLGNHRCCMIRKHFNKQWTYQNKNLRLVLFQRNFFLQNHRMKVLFAKCQNRMLSRSKLQVILSLSHLSLRVLAYYRRRRYNSNWVRTSKRLRQQKRSHWLSQLFNSLLTKKTVTAKRGNSHHLLSPLRDKSKHSSSD